MHRNYRDITDLISEEPRWYDENAVPRYCEYSPKAIANIYSQETALVLIKCQNCSMEFKVAFSERNLQFELWDMATKERKKNLSDLIQDGSLHYGDPPNIDCCGAGPTMNSIPIRVVEYWYKPVLRGEGVKDRQIIDMDALNFQRDTSLEIVLRD